MYYNANSNPSFAFNFKYDTFYDSFYDFFYIMKR